MAVERSAAPPLYRQVRDVVAARVTGLLYAPGDRLPSEPALAEELGVHRLTVRRALEELAREGVLEARQGSGTYVRHRPAPLSVSIPLSREEFATSLRAELAAQGQHFREVLLSSGPDDSAQARLDLELPDAPLVRVDSALEVDGETWVCSASWAPADRLPDVAGRWREDVGVYGLLLEHSPGALRYVWRSFAAEAAGPDDAARLGVRPGSPLLVREGLTADASGRPLVRVRRRARADRVRYVLDYDAPQAPAGGR